MYPITCSEDNVSCTPQTSSLRILHNVCASAGVPEKYLSEAHRTKIVSLCVRLWDDATSPRQATDYPPLQATTAALYRLSVTLIQYLEDKDIVKVCMFVSVKKSYFKSIVFAVLVF